MKKTLLLVLFSFASVAVYVVAFAVKRHWFPSPMVLTEGLGVLLVLLPLVLVFLFLACRKSVLSPDAGVAVFLIFFLSAMCFNLTVPAIFDRSVTVYLLNILDNQDTVGMTEEEVGREFSAVYFNRNYAIRKRLDEQTRSGNVALRDQRYYITENGRRIMLIARFISQLYALDPRIVRQRPQGAEPHKPAAETAQSRRGIVSSNHSRTRQ